MKKSSFFVICITVICITSVFFISCVSMKRDFSIGFMEPWEKDLSAIEELIIPLEAMGGPEARKHQTQMTHVRQMITRMEKEAATDADYLARLTAWSGRLAILEGRGSEARRLHRQSTAHSAGNVPAIILGIRLEGEPEKRLEIAENELVLAGRHSSLSGFGELNIEKARALMELQRFAEAVAAFDAAFASELNNVYRESFQKDRDRSWELRNFTGGSAGTLGILEQSVITWRDFISLAKNETRLLHFITAGRTVRDEELFTRLVERSFIPSTQDITVMNWQNTRPNIQEPVLRSGAAWFLWHLYAESRGNRGLLTQYSNRFATGANPRSPIADVPPLSPFFDSILGCVETELMHLPDGRNFRPAQHIRGAELLAVLQKIDG